MVTDQQVRRLFIDAIAKGRVIWADTHKGIEGTNGGNG